RAPASLVACPELVCSAYIQARVAFRGKTMSIASRSLIAHAGSCLAALLLAACAVTADAPAPDASPSPSAGAGAPRGQGPAAAPRGGGGFAADPRAQSRSYHFADANQDMPYC